MAATVESLIIDLDMLCITSDDENAVIDLAMDMLKFQAARVAELEGLCRTLENERECPVCKGQLYADDSMDLMNCVACNATGLRSVHDENRVAVLEADKRIVDLVCKIMGNGTMVVETINEALLVKMLELRGTPIPIEKTFRDIEADWAREQAYQAEQRGGESDGT